VQTFHDQSHAAITRGTSPFGSLTTADRSEPPVLYKVTRSTDEWPSESKPWHSYVESRLGTIEQTASWGAATVGAIAAARQFVDGILRQIDPPAPSVAAIDADECVEFTWQKNGMQLIASFSAENTEIVWLSKAATGSASWPSVEAFRGFFEGLTRVSSDALGASLAAE